VDSRLRITGRNRLRPRNPDPAGVDEYIELMSLWALGHFPTFR
jgi:hypothetical protein